MKVDRSKPHVFVADTFEEGVYSDSKKLEAFEMGMNYYAYPTLEEAKEEIEKDIQNEIKETLEDTEDDEIDVEDLKNWEPVWEECGAENEICTIENPCDGGTTTIRVIPFGRAGGYEGQ